MDSQEKLNQQPIDLPPVQESENIEFVQQQGSERNPELLSTDTMSQQSPSQATNKVVNSSSSSLSQATVSAQSPAIADDIDLIEKEWVIKAKEIVEKTKDNPYLQNKAMSEFKADYIKKRYNKEVAKSKE